MTYEDVCNEMDLTHCITLISELLNFMKHRLKRAL
ncbi:hypothetical protein Alvin_2531 [Allochromatium vinosum DSM 180]|uniref:Uncharacterized protein n=1 Tax=Allochromatium vinosum (strain ATCC 17899 / DSM 180 / NBRC 103801 / NCIMB 10441 / D) TaxID=572477 RepID=D3RP51_ALLVD|nr:hypothetical protein Alvin_2531 [Allochromatium vinosum DSM 180]